MHEPIRVGDNRWDGEASRQSPPAVGQSGHHFCRFSAVSYLNEQPRLADRIVVSERLRQLDQQGSQVQAAMLL